MCTWWIRINQIFNFIEIFYLYFLKQNNFHNKVILLTFITNKMDRKCITWLFAIYTAVRGNAILVLSLSSVLDSDISLTIRFQE